MEVAKRHLRSDHTRRWGRDPEAGDLRKVVQSADEGDEGWSGESTIA